ncbi:AbrB/MazE/SpoVT family DNA-binding domain-containing protein [Xylophilus sp.]|nr:AbrB/MazE/SpoVT family DNA-binding domain-containing protein [Xylophilus sp.]KAF1048718.1 MAG: hypothetical protein GAK38_01162 [Xylophilus sp.]
MPLHIARWGNSLAVRLPATLVRQAGLAAQDGWKPGSRLPVSSC